MAFKNKLISNLTKQERRTLGRKVLNLTLKNAPQGTSINSQGALTLPNGDILTPAHHGRGRNAQYSYSSSADREALKRNFAEIQKQIKADKSSPEKVQKSYTRRNDNKPNIFIPADTGSRDNDTGVLNFFRDFVVDGVGTFGTEKTDRRDRRYVPKDVWLTETKRLNRKAEYNRKIMTKARAEAIKSLTPEDKIKMKQYAKENEGFLVNLLEKNPRGGGRDPLARIMKNRRNKIPLGVIGENPDSILLSDIKSSLANQTMPSLQHGVSAIASLNRLREQMKKESIGDTISDAGNGFMAELARPFNAESSKWWKDRQNNQNSESGFFGKNIADEALYSLAGGVAGKGIGVGLKRLKRGAEMYNHKIKILAKNREQLALNRGLSIDEASKVRQNAYESLAGRKEPYSMPLSGMDRVRKIVRDSNPDGGYQPLVTTIGNVAGRAVKNSLGNKGMLRTNDNELSSIYSRVNDLRKARHIQRNRWNDLPNSMAGRGVGAGLFMGVE